MNSSFIEKCINGDASLDEIDDYIDDWHDSDSANALELHEFLGMSWKEYSLWAIQPSLLAEIVNERKRDIDSKKLVLPNV
ncbi:MAG: hypothetical protein WCQ26_04365 [Pseudanabaena sp. ELA748]